MSNYGVGDKQELDKQPLNGTYNHGKHKGNPEVHLQAVNRIVTNEGTHHIDVSMGKVNQFDNPINHGISKGK